MKFSPTRYGWLFVLVICGMLIGSVNYNNNLGFLFTFLLASMVLVSLVHSYRNLHRIMVSSIQVRPVFASQKAVFVIGLQTLSKQSFSIRLLLDDGPETIVQSISQNGQRAMVSLPTTKRGRLSPAKLNIKSDFPLGLFEFKTYYQPLVECMVYPKPVPVQKLTWQDLFMAHAPEGTALESVEDFKGLRSFQNGDATQHIFWKAFSKGQGLMVKEFEGNASPSLCFSWEKLTMDQVEKKLSLLCGMVLKAHSMKLKFGLLLPGNYIRPGTGKNHKHACLRMLALF